MQIENFPKAIDDFEKIELNAQLGGHASKIHKATLNSFLGHCYLSLGHIESALHHHKIALETSKGKIFLGHVKMIYQPKF